MKAVIGRTGETPAALVFPECGDPRLNVPPALLPGGCGGEYLIDRVNSSLPRTGGKTIRIRHIFTISHRTNAL